MKRLTINYFFIGVIALLLALALWPNIPWRSSQDDQLRQILSRGELRVSTIVSPLTYSLHRGSPSGLDYELAKRFADYLGVKLVVSTRQNIDELFTDLDNGDADMLAAGLIYSDDRTQSFRAGPTYYSVSQQLVYRLGSPRHTSLGKLKGRLAVLSGSAQISTLREQQSTQYPNLTWETSTNISELDLLKQVVDGRLDYTIADSISVGLLQRIYPQLAVADRKSVV